MLHANNACNLGSIDVAKFIEADGTFNTFKFKFAVYNSVRFLDNVIAANQWPTSEIHAVVMRTRPIGLGLMGVADAMLKLGLRYGSEESLTWLRELMEKFQSAAWAASLQLGEEKGAFPEYDANKEAYTNHFCHIFGAD